MRKYFIRNVPSPSSIAAKLRLRKKKRKRKKKQKHSVTGESMTRVDSPVPLMHIDPDRSWITDAHPDHPKGTQPKSAIRHPHSWCPLHCILSLNEEIPGARTVNCCVSNMAAKVRFDLPWLLSSLDNSGLKNGLALIGNTH